MNANKFIPSELNDKYEFHNFGHALEILSQACPEEWNDILDCLHNLSITRKDILAAGGNESPIPKKFDDQLYPKGWREIKITGDLIVKLFPRRNIQRRGQFSEIPFDQKIIFCRSSFQ